MNIDETVNAIYKQVKEIYSSNKNGKIPFNYITKSYIKLVCLIEGFRNTVYLDSLGNKTVGIGHLVTISEYSKYPRNATISDEDVIKLAAKDIVSSSNYCYSQGGLNTVTCQQWKNVLLYLWFNMGTKCNNFVKTLSIMKTFGINDANNMKLLLELADSKWATQCPRALRIITNYLLLGEIKEDFLNFNELPPIIAQILKMAQNKKIVGRFIDATMPLLAKISIKDYLTKSND